jgi:hypothetical protein
MADELFTGWKLEARATVKTMLALAIRQPNGQLITPHLVRFELSPSPA